MKIFISGGCKNGKSLHAQRIAKKMHRQGKPLYYLATMIPADDEDESRIRRHQRERSGWGFETVEVTCDIYTSVVECDLGGTFLLDSVTALLANEMFTRDGNVIRDAYQKVASELKATVRVIENIVIVSDGIYSDAVLYDDLTEQYRYGLAYIDKAVAKACDVVLEACYGNLWMVKGAEVFENFYREPIESSPDVDGDVFGFSRAKEQLE